MHEQQPKMSDWVKKLVAAGIDLGGELKLPKETLISLLAQADKTKKEVVNAAGRELRGFLDNIDVYNLLLRILSGATFEIEAKIRVVPAKNGEGLQVEVVRKNVSKTAAREKPKKKAATKKKKPLT